MKISELSNLLTKVQSIGGDLDVVLQDAKTELETVINDLAVHISPESGTVDGKLVIAHGDAPPVQEPLPEADANAAS